jgi:hypothetical protein
LLGPASTGTGTIALDPTFGSFTLLEWVSYSVNWFLWWKCLDCLDWNGIFLGVQSVNKVGRYKHLIYWQGQRVFLCLVSQFSKLRCERFFKIVFWVDFVARNSNKLHKLALDGWMNECVHTLGPPYLRIAKFRNSGTLFLLFVGSCLLRED